MGRTVTLKGPAAAAFMDAKMGKSADTEEARVDRVLAFLEMEIKAGTKNGRDVATMIVKSIADKGLAHTADLLTEGKVV